MALVVPNTHGETVMLRRILGLTAATDHVMKVFTNNVTPSDTTILANLTEATEPGYAPITLAASNWTVAQASGVTTGAHPEQTFTFTTEVQAYGVFFVDASNQLIWLERFAAAPVTLPTGGGELVVEPTLSLS